MIGTPSQYTKSKLVGLHSPTSLKKGEYFANISENGKIVGSLYVERYNELFVIRDLFVLPESRGHGLGRNLLVEVLSVLKPKKRDIILYVDPENSAKSLYESVGFKLIKKDTHFGDKYLLA